MNTRKLRELLEMFALDFGYKMTDIERKTLFRTIITLVSFDYPENRKNVISKRTWKQIIKRQSKFNKIEAINYNRMIE